MSKQAKRRAGWAAWAMAGALALPLAAAEPPSHAAGEDPPTRVRWHAGTWMQELIARAADRLRSALGGEWPTVERSDARGAHHLTIEPGGDALPPPTDDDPPSGG